MENGLEGTGSKGIGLLEDVTSKHVRDHLIRRLLAQGLERGQDCCAKLRATHALLLFPIKNAI